MDKVISLRTCFFYFTWIQLNGSQLLDSTTIYQSTQFGSMMYLFGFHQCGIRLNKILNPHPQFCHWNGRSKLKRFHVVTAPRCNRLGHNTTQNVRFGKQTTRKWKRQGTVVWGLYSWVGTPEWLNQLNWMANIKTILLNSKRYMANINTICSKSGSDNQVGDVSFVLQCPWASVYLSYHHAITDRLRNEKR
jgi:hypothetical protein